MLSDQVKITYTNNSGLLFRYGNVKILIDGLEEDVNTFDTPPREVKEFIKKNVFASTGKNILLFTHCHDDHFSDAKTAEAVCKNIDFAVIPDDEDIKLCTKQAMEGKKIYIIPKQCIEKKIKIAEDVEVKMMQTTHLPFPGASTGPHYAIALRFASEKYFIAGDSDPDNVERIQKECPDGFEIAFFNPVILGRPKTMKLIKEGFCKKLVIYHLPSEETDQYNYRSMASSMAKKYKDIEKIEVDLLLSKLCNYK